jgi:hypothetical protein
MPLPVGLTLDPNTGVISGTPKSLTSQTYTIGATGPGGKSAETKVKIVVSPVAANTISYGAAAVAFTANVPARKLTPETATGESVTGWSITPALPGGLTFNASDGSISGTPTAASGATAYTVNAQNGAQGLSVKFTIAVDTGVLVDLGHEGNIGFLQFNGSSVLSEDDRGHWVLWHYANGAIITNGDSDCVQSSACSMPGPLAALAGPTAVVRTRSGFEVLSAASGVLAANISASPSWWSLAADGTYIVAGSVTSLSAWSPSGQLLVSRAGNYSSAIGYASPGAIRIGLGPAGANAIETVSVPGGTDTISSSFNGQFNSWFADGSGFLTMAGATVLAYSNAALQESVLPSPAGTVHGQGHWIWTFTGPTLNVYTLTSPAVLAATYTFFNSGEGAAITSGSTIGVSTRGVDAANGAFSVIDLSGTTPAKVDYTPPVSSSYYITGYAATSASQWLIGYQAGVLLDGASLSGTPRYLGYGQALNVAGSANQIAIATASGSILYFNATTLASEGAIQFPAGQLALSRDGSILAAVSTDLPGAPQSVNIYAPPAASLLFSWTYPVSPTNFGVQGISLSGSGSGTVLGQTLTNGMQQVSPPTGGSPSYSIPVPGLPGGAQVEGPPQLLLSPSGTLLANSPVGDPYYTPTPDNANFGANIYQSGTLLTAVSGWPVGWIDDTHLLVNTYQPDYWVDTTTDYVGCTIYNPTGQISGTCALPSVLSFQIVASDVLYALNLNAIVSISTGATLWMSGDAVNPPNVTNSTYVSALAGKYVVFASGARVLAQAH